MDSRPIGRDTYRHLRGERSQLAVSRWLRFRSNVVYAWESGKRQPRATLVFSWVDRLGIDVVPGLKRFFRVPVPWLEQVRFDERDGVCRLLQELREDQALGPIAERSGFSRFQISRWIRGQTEIGFEDLLTLVEAMTARSLDFLAVLVDPAALPSTRQRWSQLEAGRQLFWRQPEAQLVVLALELASYLARPEHDDLFLARLLDLPLHQVVSAIDRLEASGQIRQVGNHYRRAEIRTTDTRRNPAAGDELKRWWWGQAAAGLQRESSSVSFNTFTCSKDDYEAVKEVYRGAFKTMRGIVAESKKDECLAILTSAIIRLDQDLSD